MTVKKAMASDEQFVGQCYLGQTEIVQPIHIRNKLVCIIYMGNFIELDKQIEMIATIKRNAPLIGVEPKKLLEEAKKMTPLDVKCYETASGILEVLSQFIIFAHKQIFRNVTLPNEQSPIYRGKIHPAVRTVADYISVHYSAPIKVKQLAKICFLNPEYLTKLFKKETGKTVVEYLNFIRVERAKELLTYSDEKIIDIAMLVGFNNNGYFCRQFKQTTGVSPSQYRAENPIELNAFNILSY